MVIKATVSISGFTEDFIFRVWEAESDGVGAHVYETTLVEKNGAGVPTPGAGHQVSEPVVINGMDTVVHICRIYGAVSGNKYVEFNIEPENPILTIFLPVRFKIGDGGINTPAAGDTMATTPELVGLAINNFIIHRGAYGPLYPNVNYDFDTPSGQWNLLNGDAFSEVDEITIDIKPVAVSVIVNDSVVGKLLAGFVDVAANIDYNATHLRKMVRFSGSPEYSFPLALSFPVGYIHSFNHFGADGTAKIKFLNGALLWGAVPKTEILIPKYTEAAFIWDGANWNALYVCDSRWINAAASQLGVIASGIVNIGDVPPGDPFYTVTHNKAIIGDYDVWLQVRSNNPATFFRDNKVGSTVIHDVADKPNKFNFSLQEISGETQNLSISWVIIKTA